MLRKSTTEKGEFAGELLGLHKQEGLIHSLHGLDIDRFFSENPVDIVIDFSNHTTLKLYCDAVRKHGYKLISAISNYPDDELSLIHQLS